MAKYWAIVGAARYLVKRSAGLTAPRARWGSERASPRPLLHPQLGDRQVAHLPDPAAVAYALCNGGIGVNAQPEAPAQVEGRALGAGALPHCPLNHTYT